MSVRVLHNHADIVELACSNAPFLSAYSLVDTLPPHLEASNLDPSLDLDELPEDITLAQTASTWKYIIQFQAQQKQH
ncbi:hypothetical protein GBAR_LOCUS1744 [Geodia barretti]|uniref:Uncharacterized protein n=1 Tax=Geodia barretti TaxID=519541 RepID=A0AA35QYR6_GEOBA|nr:hypothetical protein GBAR_LOCUS1744 [Geodia barretti]